MYATGISYNDLFCSVLFVPPLRIIFIGKKLKSKSGESEEPKSGGSNPIPNPEEPKQEQGPDMEPDPGPASNLDAGDNPVANPAVDPNATGA